MDQLNGCDIMPFVARPPTTRFEKTKDAEREARRVIEDRCGLVVHDANVLFRENCPNIDLVVFAHAASLRPGEIIRAACHERRRDRQWGALDGG